MSEWQPIETVPKDGTRILVWNALEFAEILHFADGTWFDDANESGHIVFTHWMPLPEPPESPVEAMERK